MNLSELEYDEAARAEATQAALAWLTKHPQILQYPLLLVVNMKEPSYHKRAYVYDIKKGEYVANHHTTHGNKSCSWHSQALATKFSNIPESRQTSLGMMRVGEEYEGRNGSSLKLKGLEACNNKVEERCIVLHKANYVTTPYIQQMGRAGCSWGCFAFDPTIWYSLKELLVLGTLLYCYYPEGGGIG